MKLSKFGALATAALLAGTAAAQDRPGPTKLTTHALGGGAYWVEGGRSNTGFIVGTTGVVVIDTQMTEDAVKMEAAEIAAVTPKPVDAVIVSHADPDHAGGLNFYPAGLKIVEHENNFSEQLVSANDPSGPPPLRAIYQRLTAEHRPTHTVGATETMTVDGVPIQLLYYGPAHTSGDLIVYLPKQKIVYAADVIVTNAGDFPIIHFGGSTLGWIAAMKGILALDVNTYVAGHGAFKTKAELRTWLAAVETRRDAIKAMVEAGKSLAEIQAAFPEPGASPMFMNFTQTVYTELTKGYPAASPPWTNLIHH